MNSENKRNSQNLIYIAHSPPIQSNPQPGAK